mgnify:FL=1|jgi:hypothetical protein
MQIIECENCHGYFELPEDSFERLNRVLKAGSGSIYLKCPYCNETTALNRFTDLYTDVGLLKRTENPEVNIQYGLLPQKYEHCIQNLGVTVSINHEQYKLYSIKELFTNVNIDGHCYAQIRQLQGFSNTLNELSEISSKEREVLNDALAIGEGDGSVLFALPKDFELSVFYTDGSYISPLHLTINSLIKKITNIK